MFSWLSRTDPRADLTLALSEPGLGRFPIYKEIKVHSLVLQVHAVAFRSSIDLSANPVFLDFATVGLRLAFEDLIEFCYSDQLPTAAHRLARLEQVAEQYGAHVCQSQCADALQIALENEPKRARAL